MPSFGEELKRERELRRISLREVAEATKVNLRYLEALESNDFEHLPGGVFNRGFVRAYSQFIGVDPDAMVDAYRLEEQAQATRGKARDRDLFHRPRRKKGPPDTGTLPETERRHSAVLRWTLIVLVIGAVIVGAVLLYLNLSDKNEARMPAVESSGDSQTRSGRQP
jgi:cytoskeletal protein RodZ